MRPRHVFFWGGGGGGGGGEGRNDTFIMIKMFPGKATNIILQLPVLYFYVRSMLR